MNRRLLTLALAVPLIAGCRDVSGPTFAGGPIVAASNGPANGLQYELRETIPLPAGASFVAARDMDGDGVLDIVSLLQSGTPTLWVTERDGASFVTRFTVTDPSRFRGAFVHDLDRDGLPEIVTGHFSDHYVRIWEASGNDAYVERHAQAIGHKISGFRAGDSDGDGLTELLVGRESFPTRLHFIEATSNDVYVDQGYITGGGGNISPAGVRDINGNGVPDVAFSDDSYTAAERVQIFENGNNVYYDASWRMRIYSLSDTDANGLIEVIGFERGSNNTKVIEYTGGGYNLVEVYNAPGYHFLVIDVDNDGREEFWRAVDNGSGQKNVFTLGHRTGATISDIYDSGTLLQFSSADIRRVWAIGDTDGDGALELAVQQGDEVHILDSDVSNQPPTVAADTDPVQVDEGLGADNTGTVGDADGDAVTLSASVGTITNNGDGTWSWSYPTTDGPAESQTVTIDADDGNGGTAQTSFRLTVDNVAPTVDAVTVPGDPVAIGDQPVSASGTFSDPAGAADEPYACTADYDDGSGPQAGAVAGTECTGPNQTYAEAGVYVVTIEVTDKDGGPGSLAGESYLVIYDPSAGFVTGGGWIDSPPGAYVPDPDLVGKANFGFVARYKKGATTPTGKTEFQFKAGDLNFHSSSYDWMVVNQGGSRAQYKGIGTINGGLAPNGEEYKFMLWAGDGDPDTLRMKIWWEEVDGTEVVVYDNGVEQAIGGGSITIHTK